MAFVELKDLELDRLDDRLASAVRSGLAAIGGDLSVPRLLYAYRNGMFPWTVNPVTWWSPDPRPILELNEFHVPRSLRAVLKKGVFSITFDAAFRDVIEQCAAPAPGRRKTWITPEFISAYCELHRLGISHSVEAWLDGKLAGGVYGVALGGFFAGESMFYHVSNASKVALCHLVERLRERGFTLFDIQSITPVTRQLGATSIPRDIYLKRLQQALEMRVFF